MVYMAIPANSPLLKLPSEIKNSILHFTNPCSLNTCLLTCKAMWSLIESNHSLWDRVIEKQLIETGHRTAVFSPEEWKKLGEIAPFSHYPRNLCSILDENSRYFGAQKVGQTAWVILIPGQVNRKDYDNSTVQQVFQGIKGAAFSRQEQAEEILNNCPRKNKEPYWLLVTSTLIPGSKGLSKLEHLSMVKKYNDRIPNRLEAITAVFVSVTQELPMLEGKGFSTRCFEDDEKEEANTTANIGYLTPTGLCFSKCTTQKNPSMGTLAARTLGRKALSASDA